MVEHPHYTTSISHGVEKYFPRLWGTGISDAIFFSVLPVFHAYISFSGAIRRKVELSHFTGDDVYLELVKK